MLFHDDHWPTARMQTWRKQNHQIPSATEARNTYVLRPPQAPRHEPGGGSVEQVLRLLRGHHGKWYHGFTQPSSNLPEEHESPRGLNVTLNGWIPSLSFTIIVSIIWSSYPLFWVKNPSGIQRAQETLHMGHHKKMKRTYPLNWVKGDTCKQLCYTDLRTWKNFRPIPVLSCVGFFLFPSTSSTELAAG